MTATRYDAANLDAYRRDRLRRLEQRVQMLDELNGRLYRILSLALISACAGTNVHPTDLLWALEEVERGAE